MYATDACPEVSEALIHPSAHFDSSTVLRMVAVLGHGTDSPSGALAFMQRTGGGMRSAVCMVHEVAQCLLESGKCSPLLRLEVCVVHVPSDVVKALPMPDEVHLLRLAHRQHEQWVAWPRADSGPSFNVWRI